MDLTAIVKERGLLKAIPEKVKRSYGSVIFCPRKSLMLESGHGVMIHELIAKVIEII